MFSTERMVRHFYIYLEIAYLGATSLLVAVRLLHLISTLTILLNIYFDSNMKEAADREIRQNL